MRKYDNDRKWIKVNDSLGKIVKRRTINESVNKIGKTASIRKRNGKIVANLTTEKKRKGT